MHNEDKAYFTHEQIVVEGTVKDVHILQNMDGTKDATIRMTNVSFEEFKPKHDPKTYYPEIGDTIFVKTSIREISAVVIATSDRKMSRTAFMARDVTGELLALDCANHEVTIRLMVRNGKPILQSYL